MLTRLRRRGRDLGAGGDAGVSLTELIVAMTLATILAAVTLRLFVTVNESTASTTDRTVNTAQARNTLQSWSAYLHVADGVTIGTASTRFEWLTPGDLLFYASLANRSGSLNTTAAPTMVWLRRDTGGALVEEQFPSTATAGAPWSVCRVLGFKVAATSVFTALDANGNGYGRADLGAAPTGTTGCHVLPVLVPSRSGTPHAVAVANLTTVASVYIAFTMSDTKGQHAQAFASLAALPTLGGA